MRRALLHAFVALTVGLLTLWLGPSTWCAMAGGRWTSGDPTAPRALAEGVGAWIDRGVDADRFSTGHGRFDDEWVFGTYLMAAAHQVLGPSRSVRSPTVRATKAWRRARLTGARRAARPSPRR